MPSSATMMPRSPRSTGVGSDSDFQRSDAGKADPKAGAASHYLREDVVTVRAAQDDTGASKDVNRPDRLAGATVGARPDGRRHLDSEHLPEQTRDRIAVDHQCVHLSLPSVRSARP